MLAAGRAAHNTLLRLKSADEFERVRRDGRSHAHPLVVLVARRRGPAEIHIPGPTRVAGPLADDRSRFGIVAGKGVGPAVDRNRAKRLLREAARRCAAGLAPGWDLVLIARKPLAEAKQPQAELAVRELLRRAGVLKELEA